jgi:hypothetical protein
MTGSRFGLPQAALTVKSADTPVSSDQKGGPFMARNSNSNSDIPKELIEHLTTSTHYGCLETMNDESAIKHGFVALVPRGTDMNDPMVALELCPIGQLVAPRKDGRFISFDYTEMWDQFFFSISGDPLQQLRDMTLPAGSAALTFSGLVQLARPQRVINNKATKSSTPELIDAFLTMSVARQGKELTLMTKSGQSSVHTIQTASPIKVAMREVLIRSSNRNNTH